MSGTGKLQPTASSTVPSSRRPYDGVMIALSAALLVIFGIVLGRFAVTARAVSVVDQIDAEASTLRAQIVELNRQLVRAESRVEVLQESASELRSRAALHRNRADELAAQHDRIEFLRTDLVGQRQACLDELHRYMAVDQPLKAEYVIGFAREMFAAQESILLALSQHEPSATVQATRFSPERSQPAAPATGDTIGTQTNHSPRGPSFEIEPTPARNLPTLPTHSISATKSIPVHRDGKGTTYFPPPKSRASANRSTFLAPGRRRVAETGLRTSGIVFHDSVASNEDQVRR